MSDPIRFAPTRLDPARPAERTLLLSSAFGTIIEWYDFFVFASAAALVFDRAFFPRADPRVGVLLALMTYAIGFVTRPLGGVVFGVLGDRYGRKRALVWSLGLMGVATMGIGLVPDYATIGVAAPVLLVLLRLVQGLAVGGEVGGALLLVTESIALLIASLICGSKTPMIATTRIADMTVTMTQPGTSPRSPSCRDRCSASSSACANHARRNCQCIEISFGCWGIVISGPTT